MARPRSEHLSPRNHAQLRGLVRAYAADGGVRQYQLVGTKFDGKKAKRLGRAMEKTRPLSRDEALWVYDALAGCRASRHLEARRLAFAERCIWEPERVAIVVWRGTSPRAGRDAYKLAVKFRPILTALRAAGHAGSIGLARRDSPAAVVPRPKR